MGMAFPPSFREMWKKEKNEAQKEVKIWLTAPFLMGYNTGCPMFSWGVKQLTFF